MSLSLEMITVDCADPRRLAAWWAEAVSGSVVNLPGGDFVLVAREGWPALAGLAPWLHGCPLVPSATVMRRAAYLAVGGMEPDLRGGEDWNLWLKLALAGYRFAWLPEVVCRYRVRRASLSNQANSMARD